MVVQQKTHKPVQFEITELTRIAINDWLAKSLLTQKDWLFPCRKDRAKHITTRQYARLVSEWIAKIGLAPRVYGTHSMRRTKASIIYRKTGNIRAVQLLLGHTKLDSTVRYLGVEVEDALNLSEGIEV
jgi:site-specific recombinase XerC